MDQDQFPFAEEYDWQKRQLIGQGGFAYVYRVKNRKNGCYYAVKQLQMDKFDQDFKLQALDTQIKAMKECQSPFIVKMYKSFKGRIYTYLILELCQQNLKQYMQKKLILSQAQSATVISNIVFAYKIIQMSSYIHRDLKPKNILLKNCCFKITDFGFAKKYSHDFQKLYEVCGTQLYMAPQLLYAKEYTDKCDVWSLGLILFQLLFAYLPWCTIYADTYRREVVTRDVSFPYNYRIGENTKSFIQRCLQLQQYDRISWKQIYDHPFVANKDPGKIVEYKQISVNLQNILGRVQNSNYNNFINAKKLFKEYENQTQMDRKKFYQFLMRLDPQITTYQSNEIFQAADEQKNGLINIYEFKKFYLQIDYRPPQDLASKKIEEIVKVAQAKNIKGIDLFRILDTDKSQHLQQKQFNQEIRKIVPMLEDRELQIIWKKIDQDNSGNITWKQFLQSIIREFTANQKVHFKNYDRAIRNVLNLRQFFVQKNIIPYQLFQVKKGNSNLMTLDEFGQMIRSINYSITRDQIVEMFRLIDQNDSQAIEIIEIQKLLQGQIKY